MPLLSCLICGSEIFAVRRTKKFCDPCKAARHLEVARASSRRNPRLPRDPLKEKSCKSCGERFETRKAYQVYCGACRDMSSSLGPSDTYYLRTGGAPIAAALNCAACGCGFQPRAKRQQFCSRRCRVSVGSAAPAAVLNNRMRVGIHASLRGAKKGRKWQDLVGYSSADLKTHIEKQFTTGMSWGNFGEWHIDHRVPLSSFIFSDPESPEFRAAWSLNNLQPLWAVQNIRKKAKRLYLL